jgi:hypothetical protein
VLNVVKLALRAAAFEAWPCVQQCTTTTLSAINRRSSAPLAEDMQVNKTDAASDYYGSFAPSQITATAVQSKGSCYCVELSLCLWKKKEEEEEED